MNDSLEDYLLTLGKLALITQLLNDAQGQMAHSGILTADEMELAETINWRVQQLQTAINDQVLEVCSRTPQTWEETLNIIRGKLNG